MGGEGATSPSTRLIVVFDTNLLEGCCKLGAFQVKVFLLENLEGDFSSSCFLNICKLDGCWCREEVPLQVELPKLEGC